MSLLLATELVDSMAAGCANSSGNDSSGSSSSSSENDNGQAGLDSGVGEVTLTVLAGQSTTDAGIENMIDDALAEKYLEITLEWECADWGNDSQSKMQ